MTEEEVAPEYPNLTFAYRDGDPWADIFGAFRDSPYFDEWQEAIRANRREREAEEAESDRLVKAA